jgi:DNA (cytosine-5)-methyltransferase 1
VNLRFGDLFSGAGGFSLGISQARFAPSSGEAWILHPAWAVDSNPDACATYRLNMHGGDQKADVRCADVRMIDGATLGAVDLLAFGFPCNDFSQVGERRGMRGSHGPLYLEAIRMLRHLRPMAFIAENVVGLKSSHGGKALAQVLHDLTRSGYCVTPHLYRCEHYGVPQLRHRIIIVGIRRWLRMRFLPPAPGSQIVTARQALAAPVPPGIANAEPFPASHQVVERLRAIRPGENIWEAQMRQDFPPECRLNVKGARLDLIYRRIDPCRPAGTVLGSGGGGTLGYHWAEPRPLTNRERARLQTFPDGFRFVGTQQSVRRQIGMAVPPLIARTVTEALIMTLAGRPYPSVESNIRWQPGRLAKGRPRRLEAKSEADRARAHRSRRVTENRIAAQIIARAFQRGLLSGTPLRERALAARFVARILGPCIPETGFLAAAE